MGRYFLYRMHPLSVAELLRTELSENMISEPIRPSPDTIPQLLRFGGFSEPLLKSSMRFYNRWQRLRNELLFRDDLRDLTQIHEAGLYNWLSNEHTWTIASGVGRSACEL